MPSPPQSRRNFNAPWVLFWAGFALRLSAILIGHTYRLHGPRDHFGFGWEAGRIAQSLATGHGYANPFNGPSGPTAWLAPLYPLLMALAFKVFGVYSSGAALFLMTCDSVFSAAIAPAIYEIAARCFDAHGLGRRASTRVAPVAQWAGWLWAVYPAALQYAVHWIWEMSLSTCLFTWSLVFALRLRRIGDTACGSDAVVMSATSIAEKTISPEQAASPASFSTASTPGSQPVFPAQQRLRLWAGCGLLWGLLTLCNPSLLLCLPAITLWILYSSSPDTANPRRLRAPAELKYSAVGAGLAWLVFAMVLAPWVVRNEIVLHAFVPTRSNGGSELYASTLESNDAFPWGTTLPLWSGDPEFQRFVRMGEIPYTRMRGLQAATRLRAHPQRFLRYTLDRFLFFWDGTPHPPQPHPVLEFLRQLNYASLSLCGLLGLGLMWRQRVPAAGLFVAIFALAPLPYYVITVQPRFRHPLEPLISILGVYLFRSTSTSRQSLQARGSRRLDPEAR